jgi:hypothetical protein
MRMIFEDNVEREDFLELILTEIELERLNQKRELIRDFPPGLRGERNLNVFLRVDEFQE